MYLNVLGRLFLLSNHKLTLQNGIIKIQYYQGINLLPVVKVIHKTISLNSLYIGVCSGFGASFNYFFNLTSANILHINPYLFHCGSIKILFVSLFVCVRYASSPVPYICVQFRVEQVVVALAFA